MATTCQNQINENWNRITDELVKNKNVGHKWKKMLDDHPEISYEDAKQLSDYRHAAHLFLWSKNDGKLWEIDLIASILMQMRFDGYIGFPGGIIDSSDKSWEEGLNRELIEEMNLDEQFFINRGNHFFSSVNHDRKLVLHFYTKQVSGTEYSNIEKTGMSSLDYGGEVLGILRPPLHEINHADRSRGFSIFIQNQFIGNALIQLLKSINHLEILSIEKIIYFLKNC